MLWAYVFFTYKNVCGKRWQSQALFLGPYMKKAFLLFEVLFALFLFSISVLVVSHFLAQIVDGHYQTAKKCALCLQWQEKVEIVKQRFYDHTMTVSYTCIKSWRPAVVSSSYGVFPALAFNQCRIFAQRGNRKFFLAELACVDYEK